MSNNINELKAQFGAGARPTQFSVAITNPINPIADIKVPITVKASMIPGWTQGIIELGYKGRKIKIPGDKVYREWTTTVRNDEDFDVRNAIEIWMNAMNHPEDNIATAGSNPNTYKSQGTVTQTSITGEELRVYQLNGLWPTDIADIPLDWDTNDTVEEFDVTWAFDSLEVVAGTTGSGGSL